MSEEWLPTLNDRKRNDATEKSETCCTYESADGRLASLRRLIFRTIQSNAHKQSQGCRVCSGLLGQWYTWTCRSDNAMALSDTALSTNLRARSLGYFFRLHEPLTVLGARYHQAPGPWSFQGRGNQRRRKLVAGENLKASAVCGLKGTIGVIEHVLTQVLQTSVTRLPWISAHACMIPLHMYSSVTWRSNAALYGC